MIKFSHIENPGPAEKEHGAMLKAAFFIMLAAAVMPCRAAAHPHIFIENSVKVMFDASGMTGVRLHWVFDEMFSSTMIAEYDRNKNGSFEPKELAALRKGAFANLKNYHYFAYITIGKKPHSISSVNNFQASIHNNSLSYSFFIPCTVKADASPQKVTIAVYDETYYSDIVLADYRCDHSRAPGAVASTITSKENVDKSFYYGQVAPVELLVTLKKTAP